MTQLQTQNKYLTPFECKHLNDTLKDDNLPENAKVALQIMLLFDQGKTQSEICQELKCSNDKVKIWVAMAKSGVATQWENLYQNLCKRGPKTQVNENYLARLKELANHSPQYFGYKNSSRWSGTLLSRHLKRELGIEVSGHHVNRLLKKMGLSIRPKKDANEQQSSSGIVIKDL